MRGRSGERGPGVSVLAARHDDDDIYLYIYIYIYIYICVCVCVCVCLYIYRVAKKKISNITSTKYMSSVFFASPSMCTYICLYVSISVCMRLGDWCIYLILHQTLGKLVFCTFIFIYSATVFKGSIFCTSNMIIDLQICLTPKRDITKHYLFQSEWSTELLQ